MAKFAAALVTLLACVAGSLALGDWGIIAKDLLTTELCVAFTDAQTGYVAGDGNGSGPEVLKTTDGGQTWNPLDAAFGIDILLLGCDAVDDTIVVAGISGEVYSDDAGASFNHSIGGGLSQSVRYVGKDGDGGKRFAIAAGLLGVQGIGVSRDGGHIFRHHNANLFTLSRYVACPTNDIWYIAAGAFPTTPDDYDAQGNLLRRTAFQNSQGKFVPHPLKVQNETGNYQAQLAKTTDGGKTWTTLFAQNNTFYFNGIDCNPSDPNHCCVVAEADDGAYAGARIMCTRDGTNFNTTFSAPATSGESYSLIDIRFANSTFAWATGGDLTSAAPKAWFLATFDGGDTWQHTDKELFGYYAMSLSVLTEDLSFAAIDDLITQSSGVAKYQG